VAKKMHIYTQSPTSATSGVTIQLYYLLHQLGPIVLHGVLSIGAVCMALPFFWMVLSSLKAYSEIFVVPPKWIPDRFVWENYVRSWQALPFGRAYLNSFYIAVAVVASQLLTCSMAGYAFARIRFPFREALFVLFLATLMVPFHVTLIPLFLVVVRLGWIDSHLSLIVPNVLNAFGVFLTRQFIRGIPFELEEAAILDGANRWRIFWRIILPLIKPPLAALAIFSFLGQWNSFLMPLIFLNSTEKFTVPLLLAQFAGLYVTNWSLMLAGSAIAVIPVLVVYLLGQRYIIEGVAVTGLK